ncbi:unnamed protein product [Bursaphelenchus xylophilus]|uniref:(pine wood nematode) hypothetical protein n=1 Tax=Bursaphelenchus xylophilus TaxID=6326 RepID=A0A7I8XJ01_BURXY|nr:unnamed protein product [Bursaphelenchus xylophilus]CAG9085123.1 unnamed protein product [Bursaphelenchus xylophilus]
MSQKDAFPKLYRIPKKNNSKQGTAIELLTSSPLLKSGVTGCGVTTPTKVRVSKAPEKRKLKNEKSEKLDVVKRKQSQSLNRQTRTSVNRDPIELLDSIWKEMEEDDKRKRVKDTGEECFTSPGSPAYQHTSTPTPSTSQAKFTKYELLSAPKDDTVLKRLMCKMGLMERILAYKIKYSKMETYRNMRIHGKLDECRMPDDEGVDYGVPQFDGEFKKSRGPRTPPGKGPQTPPGSPDIESEVSHEGDWRRGKASHLSDVDRTKGSYGDEEDEVKKQNQPRTPPMDNSSSSNKTEDGECSFVLPPPPPPPMIDKPSTPKLQKPPQEGHRVPVNLCVPPPTNLLPIDLSKPPPHFNMVAPPPFIPSNVPPPRIPAVRISPMPPGIRHPLVTPNPDPSVHSETTELNERSVLQREKPPTNFGPPLLPPIERARNNIRFPIPIDTSRPPPPFPPPRYPRGFARFVRGPFSNSLRPKGGRPMQLPPPYDRKN